MRRRQFIRFVGGAVAAWPFTAHAQSTKMPQIGVLSLGRGDKSDGSLSTINAFMPALRELGYTEGLNIAFERKFADGDAKKLSGLAQELVDRLRPTGGRVVAKADVDSFAGLAATASRMALCAEHSQGRGTQTVRLYDVCGSVKSVR